MFAYIFRRMLSIIPLLLGISVLVFILMYVAPGDFLSEARHSKDVSPEIVRQQEIKFGLDKPWYVQYGRWMNSVSPIKTSLLLPEEDAKKHSIVYLGTPDFGHSWAYKIPVSQLLKQRMESTLLLAISSILLTYLVAVPLGVLAAIKKGGIFDRLSAFLAYGFLSIPSFFLALLAVIFAALTGLLPTGGQSSISSEFMPLCARMADRLAHLILPTLVLSLGGIASVMRVMRTSFLDYSKAEFATTARAKGASENAIMFKHVLRNAINPIITSFGFAFSGLLSGALLVENVMNYPGLGQLIYSAIMKQDQYLVMAGVVMACVMLVLGQLLADILLALTDPRISLENEKLPHKAVAIFLASALFIAAFAAYLSESHPAIFEYMTIAAKWACKIFYCVLCALLALGFIAALVYFFKNFWPKILRIPRGIFALLVLAALYFAAAFAPLIAPYNESDACLSKAYHPPTKIFFKDWRPNVQVYENIDPSSSSYIPIKGNYLPLRFWVKKDGAKLFGLIPVNRTLFGVDKNGEGDNKVYVLGSDATGRDVFSRLLYGAQISLSIGFIGIAITLVIGFIVGGLSGYFGGTFDFFAMRLVEFLMAIPSLYLLLAMRSALSQNYRSDEMYYMIVIILSVLGWAGAARVIRGMSLSLAKRQFVQAAQAMGQPPVKIILRHFLPNVLGFLIVSATLSIPAYILGEAALSFLGLGIMEPQSSWGLMLSYAQRDTKIIMQGFWWMLTPGVAILITVLAFNILGDVLRDIADPKK